MDETNSLKVLCALDIDDNFELTSRYTQSFEFMEIGFMDPKDAMQLMFDINKNQMDFKKKYVIFGKGGIEPGFKDHKIFKDIKWTP